MAQDREFKFIVGVETSTLPAVTTPTVDDDLMTKGYADSQYAELDSWYDSVADVTAAKAIAAADRADRQVLFIKAQAALYYFDSGSSATGDDNLVLTPNAGTGRWLKIVSQGDAPPIVWTINGPIGQLYDTFDGWFRATANRTLATLKITANDSGTGTTTVQIERWSGGPSGAGTANLSLTGTGTISSNSGAISLSLVDGDLVRAKLTAIASGLEDIRVETV